MRYNPSVTNSYKRERPGAANSPAFLDRQMEAQVTIMYLSYQYTRFPRNLNPVMPPIARLVCVEAVAR